MRPDEPFTDEMKEAARYFGGQYESRIEMIWQEDVVEPLMRKFDLDEEAAEILAADYS